MKFWLALVNVPEVKQYVELARCAEALGFEGITVADHLIWPTRIDSQYPYTPDGKVWWPDDLPWPDPWVTLAAMGTATSRLKLATNIFLLALRDPFSAAKAIATASVLTNERIVCGISSGWIKEEYQLAGVDFHTRGRRMDEMVTIMRALWRGVETSHAGEFFQFEHALLSPVPEQPIPVWCGGGAPAALKRAARNDGWLGLPMTVEQLRGVTAQLRQYRQEAGKADQPFEISAMLLDVPTPENLAELDALGVSNLMVLPWLPSPWDGRSYAPENADPADLSVKRTSLERFSERVMQPVGVMPSNGA